MLEIKWKEQEENAWGMMVVTSSESDCMSMG